MRTTTAALIGALVALVGMAEAAQAASFPCNGPRRSLTELAICRDARLSRLDEQLARRFKGVSRQLRFGPYLGLRIWRRAWTEERDRCGVDRLCLTAAYRAQQRFLERLARCLDDGARRRACLRLTLNGERAARR
jgi:uncharacterized protein